MAGGGDNGDMNPFISYVDLFSSVILVLLLFVLIMFVNVGYYMQFNSKDAKTPAVEQTVVEEAQTVTQKETKKEENKEKEKQKMVSAAEETNNTTPVQGGEVEGNTLSKKTEKTAIAEFQESDMLIIFRNNEYFLSKDIVRQASEAMSRILKTKPNAIFFVSVGDSKKLISSTQTKQVSLGRILSLKNNLDAVPELKNKIKVNYKQSDQSGFEFGYLKIDVK
jgi:sensor histidine kinase regulating citrate/malate metabolism